MSEKFYCRFCCAFFLTLVTVSVQGQYINGSAYSYYGIGSYQGRSSAYNRAMGFAGIGVRDDYNISTTNPASLNSIAKPFTSLVDIGVSYESVNHQTSTISSKNKVGGLTGLDFLFKLSPKFGMGISATPISSMTYKATSPRQFGNSPPTLVSYQGSGGINQFSLGGSYEVFKNLSLGANFNYYLGTLSRIENVASTTVTDPLQINNRSTAKNAGYDLGFQYMLPIKKTKITFGGTYDPGTTLNGRQKTSITNLNLDTLKQSDNNSISYHLPALYGGGIGIRTNRSSFAMDVQFQNWKNARMNDGQSYQDSYKYAFGYEYRGDLTSLKYLNSISIRGGAFFQNYPLLLKNTQFNLWGYTIGLALPVDGYRASVNINYTVSQLGTTDVGLVKENSNRLVIDFIIRDVWGVRRKLD